MSFFPACLKAYYLYLLEGRVICLWEISDLKATDSMFCHFNIVLYIYHFQGPMKKAQF